MLDQSDITKIGSGAARSASKYICAALGLPEDTGPNTEATAEAYGWAIIATVSYLVSMLLVNRNMEQKKIIVRLLLANIAAFAKGVEDALAVDEEAAKKGASNG